ncbi:MAG: TraR/DksA C4-type zinc finger protein [Magnetococcales bacterium]|nr:TraR/DksA C4-type zinc finger protein [Magnetococcales bacterium]
MDEVDFVQEQEERERQQAISLLLGQTNNTPSTGICRTCGQEIPARRLQALPSAQRCVTCQTQLESDKHGRF